MPEVSHRPGERPGPPRSAERTLEGRVSYPCAAAVVTKRHARLLAICQDRKTTLAVSLRTTNPTLTTERRASELDERGYGGAPEDSHGTETEVNGIGAVGRHGGARTGAEQVFPIRGASSPPPAGAAFSSCGPGRRVRGGDGGSSRRPRRRCRRACHPCRSRPWSGCPGLRSGCCRASGRPGRRSGS